MSDDFDAAKKRLEEMDRANLFLNHGRAKHADACWRCDEPWPCLTMRVVIDADHEWAQWHDKWIAALDLMGSQSERAEKAEAWLAMATDEMKAEREGTLDLRRRFGARDDETFPEFVERLATERERMKAEAEASEHESRANRWMVQAQHAEAELAAARKLIAVHEEWEQGHREAHERAVDDCPHGEKTWTCCATCHCVTLQKLAAAIKQALEQHRIVQDLGRELRAERERVTELAKISEGWLQESHRHAERAGRLEKALHGAVDAFEFIATWNGKPESLDRERIERGVRGSVEALRPAALRAKVEELTLERNRLAHGALYREAVEALEELHEVLTLGTLEAAAKYGPDYDRDAADRHAAERSEAVLAKAREVLEPEKP